MTHFVSRAALSLLPQFQFRLRTLMIGASLVAAALAPVRAEIARCQAMQGLTETILQDQGEVFFDYQLIEEGVVLRQLDSDQPHWIRSAIGSLAFANVVEIRLDNARPNSTTFDQIGQNCPQLLHLSLRGASVGEEGLRSISRCKNLNFLDLGGVNASDEGLSTFAGHEKLSTLCLEGASLSGNACVMLARLPSLHILTLDNSPIDDSDVAQIADSTTIDMLFLAGTDVTDAVIPHLARMPSLRTVSLNRTRVSREGREKLRKLRPEISQI